MARIPRVVHYVFACDPGFRNQKGWSLIHHACVRSAAERMRADKILLHCDREPTGPWWELTRPFVTLARVEAPRAIFGNPLLHPAHQSDALRLEILLREGGIYLDIDVLVQRDFDDLLDSSVVMGREGGHGTANAVLLAEPNAPFLRRWHEEYRWFRSRGRDLYWGEHSVVVPLHLARHHPDEITLLDERAFFWPLWSELDLLFEPLGGRPEPRATYANHLWETPAWDRYLEHLTPGRVRAVDSAFHRWIRPYVEGLPDNYGAPTLAERWQRVDRIGRTRIIRRRARLVDDATRILGPELMGGLRRAMGRQPRPQPVPATRLRGDALEVYVRHLSRRLQQHERDWGRPIRVVDIGCGGTAVCARLLAAVPGMTYVGCDNPAPDPGECGTEPRAEFRLLDILADDWPEGDVCLVRQGFDHLPEEDRARILPKLARYQAVYLTESQPAAAPPPPGAPVAVPAAAVAKEGGLRASLGRAVEEVCRARETLFDTAVVTYRVDGRV